MLAIQIATFILTRNKSKKTATVDEKLLAAGGSGETAHEVVMRVNNFFEFLLKKFPSGNVLVVGHNGINRFYLAFKLSMQLKNYRRLGTTKFFHYYV